ncbi:MAG TPA: hypothetical protein PKK00_00195 [Bacteroidales bacterium]|nr:hypothetical protein [Bacteroidales bacterium]HPS16263.1 hypothetical protein [Bacteroidales bacterium]
MEDQRMLPNDKEWECIMIANEHKAVIKRQFISMVNELEEENLRKRKLISNEFQEEIISDSKLISDELYVELLKGRIKKIETNYKKEDYLVSSNKTFTQLWSDYGMQYFSIKAIKLWVNELRSKEECIQKWVNILYPVPIDIKKILLDISIRQSNNRREGLKQGIRINTGWPSDCLSSEIDKRYGKYC